MQREIASGIVVNADLVYKRFRHTFLNGIDYNRFYGAAGPVIPVCTPAERNDDRAVCSNGPIYFDTTAGRARYRGLLLRLEKRMSAGRQFVVSYALGSFRGTNGTTTGTVEGTGGRATGFNNDDWYENDGPLPTDLRHVLNVSGMVTAPWRVEAAFSVSAHSRAPFSPYVMGLDFNQDGTLDDLLPGTRVKSIRPWAREGRSRTPGGGVQPRRGPSCVPRSRRRDRRTARGVGGLDRDGIVGA